MAVAYERFVRSDAPSYAAELAAVDELARRLREHLGLREDAIDRLRGRGPTSTARLPTAGRARRGRARRHLFLVVPNASWNAAQPAREHPFQRVRLRLRTFFGDRRREVDVLSVHVFGYGRDDVPLAAGAGEAEEDGEA